MDLVYFSHVFVYLLNGGRSEGEILRISGHILIPLNNVAQEVWDYIKVTDGRENSTARTGNVQYIKRTFDGMTLGFGGSGHLPGASYQKKNAVYIEDFEGYSLGVLDEITADLEEITAGLNGQTTTFDNAKVENDPELPEDVANKQYVDSKGPYLPSSGGTMTGDIDMDGNSIFIPSYNDAVAQQGSIQVSTLAFYWYASGAWRYSVDDTP